MASAPDSAESRHISDETGRVAGASRIVLGAGLVLVAGGILLFLVGVGRGLLDAAGGDSAADSMMPWLPLGGGAVVVGLIVAAIGMAIARRDAGE